MSVHWGGRGPGHGARRTRAVSAAANLTGLAHLKASDAVLAAYDPSDLNTMWQDIAGTTTQAVAGQPVGYVKNVKTGATGYHLAATSTTLRPLATNGLTFDGTDDRIEYTFPGSAGPANGTIVCLFKSSETDGAFLITGTTTTGRVTIAATTGLLSVSGAPYVTATLELDGNTVAAGAVAVNDGVAHTLVVNANLSAVVGLRVGGGTVAAQCVNGKFIPVALLDASHPDYPAALAQARAWAATLKTSLAL